MKASHTSLQNIEEECHIRKMPGWCDWEGKEGSYVLLNNNYYIYAHTVYAHIQFSSFFCSSWAVSNRSHWEKLQWMLNVEPLHSLRLMSAYFQTFSLINLKYNLLFAFLVNLFIWVIDFVHYVRFLLQSVVALTDTPHPTPLASNLVLAIISLALSDYSFEIMLLVPGDSSVFAIAHVPLLRIITAPCL